ncbi:MAG: cation:proton antiporter [Rhodospirillaceae bacterium]
MDKTALAPATEVGPKTPGLTETIAKPAPDAAPPDAGAVEAAKELPGKIAEIGAKAVDAVAGVTDAAMEASASHGAHGNDLMGIAIVVLAALLCGIFMNRVRQPAIVGYILAGVILGPAGLRVVQGRGAIELLAEMGVLLLLFLIGLELSLRSFRHVWKLSVFTTVFQVVASVAVTLLCSQVFGWSTPLSVLLGFMVALSSTAVAVKMLDDVGELRTQAGQVTVGILIAQDLTVVPMLLWVDSMKGGGFDWTGIPKIVLSVAFLAALIWYLSRRSKVVLPFANRVENNHDLRPLAALAFCFGCSAIAGLFGLSPAYGAFIAGLMVGNSTLRHAITETVIPIQSLLLMVFFLSIGLLLDLTYIWTHLSSVLLLFFLVSVFKTAINVGFLHAMGQPWDRAFMAGTMLAQIGEFSFLLSVAGVSSGVLSVEDSKLVVSVTVMSLALSPLWVITARRIQAMAHEGVESGAEFMRLVYAPETERLTETIGTAKTSTRRQMRIAALYIRRHRLRRRRKQEGQNAAAPAAAAAAEPKPQPAKVDAYKKKTGTAADKKPAPRKAALEKPTTEEPPPEKSAAKKSKADKASPSKPAPSKPNTAKPSAAKPRTTKPAPAKPNQIKPSQVKPKKTDA